MGPPSRITDKEACRHCGGKPLATPTLCAKCRERSRARARKFRDEARESGQCQWSGCKAKTEPNRSMCADHLKENSRRIGITKAKRIAEGICIDCGRQRAELPAYRCSECRDKHRAYERTRRERNQLLQDTI